MARLVVHHSPDPDALLQRAAAPLLVPGRPAEPLPLLAVRQGGIRDEIQERAAAAGCAGWLGRPLIVFAELAPLLAGELAPLSSAERLVLLERLLDESARRGELRALDRAVRSADLVQSLDATFGDWAAERVSAERARALLEAHGGDEWERGRDADVALLYVRYLEALDRLPDMGGVRRTDGRDVLAAAADAVRARPDDVAARLRRPFSAAGEPRDVDLYGLADLRRGWRALIEALRDAPFVRELRIHVLAGDAGAEGDAEVTSERALLDELRALAPDETVRVEPLGRPAPLAHVAASLFAPPGAPRRLDPGERAVRALAAPDLARELEEVARRVKALVAGGVAPHRIAVVARKARPYGTRAAELLRRYGVPVTARLRSTLHEVPVAAALLRLFAAAAGRWSRRSLAAIAESPYFDLGLDVRLLDLVGARATPQSLDAWERALADLADAAERGQGDPEYRGPGAARARDALRAFREFRTVAETLGARRSRAGWIDLTLELLGAMPDGSRHPERREGLWGVCRNACRPPAADGDPLAVDAARADAEALGEIVGLLAEWRRALELYPDGRDTAMEAGRWHAELRERLSESEIALWTPQRRGVQVVEATAALGRPYDHVFVVGMQGGAFPAEPPSRTLYAEHERARLNDAGLPMEPAEVWFAREASLFRAIAAGARASLHLSYAYADDRGTTQLPSAYFDDVASRFILDGEDPDEVERSSAGSAWIERRAGSALTVPDAASAWSDGDLLLLGAAAWRDGDRSRDTARRALGHLAASGVHRLLVDRVLHAAGAEHARRELRTSDSFSSADRAALAQRWNGRITSPDLLEVLRERFGDAVWSATRLEEYGRCGFLFFGQTVLGLRELDDPDAAEDIDGATRGSMLHACLERLHVQLAELYGDEALTSRVFRKAPQLIEHIVRRTVEEFAARGQAGPAELRRFRELELRETLERYLEWEVAENEKEQRRPLPRRRQRAAEFRFGRDGAEPARLTRGGRTLRLAGTIDRIDEIVEAPAEGWRYIVDHKSGGSALAPLGLYEDGAILQLPLYALALEALGEHGRGVWGGAYQLIGDCKRAAPLHPRTLTGGAIRHASGKNEEKAQARLDAALDRAFAHVDAITDGIFPARVASSARQCPAYCSMREVCREAQGGR